MNFEAPRRVTLHPTRIRPQALLDVDALTVPPLFASLPLFLSTGGSSKLTPVVTPVLFSPLPS